MRDNPGGIVKAAGLGDGLVQSAEDHRQASLDDATRKHEIVRRNRYQSITCFQLPEDTFMRST